MEATKRKMKWALTVLALAAIALAILFPVFAVPKDMYFQVLQRHTEDKARPRDRGQLPFLYVSWFHSENLKRGQDFAVYENGDFAAHRIMYYAIEGGRGPMRDVAAFRSFQKLSTPPPGLPGPDAVPHGRLLIVSLCHAGYWQTRYYDRRVLPASVHSLTQLIGKQSGVMI